MVTFYYDQPPGVYNEFRRVTMNARLSAERQLAVWKEHDVIIDEETRDDILRQADAFKPCSDTDKPLVSGGFGNANPALIVKKLLDALTSPSGYTTKVLGDAREPKIRYASGMKPRFGLRLIHFDPCTYAGLSVKDATKQAKQDKLRLAGIEVLEHLMLEPDFHLAWDSGLYFFPYLAGLQYKHRVMRPDATFFCEWDQDEWSDVLSACSWDQDKALVFSLVWEGKVDDRRASPVVREC